MFGLIVSAEKFGIQLIQRRGWVLELAQDWSTIDIVQLVFIVLGLVRKSSVINKYIV